MEMALKFGQARLSPPTLGQIAGEAALRTPSSYFREVIDEYVERRNVVVDGLNKIEGVICPKPQGAFYAIAQLPVKDADHFCQWILESFDYNGTTVMMAPASGFYANSKVKNQVRIAYVLKKHTLEKAVLCIKKALEVYKKSY
jgi:aspartate aminotransferase